MRIVSGTYRGRRLHSLKGSELRPTSDQMRETLFDVLGPEIANKRFLDVYAGTGAVGFEALSRGASEVVMVENHRAAVDLIARNLESLGEPEGVRVLKSDAGAALERLAAEAEPFDYIFVDPPYAEIREYHHTLRQVARSAVVAAASLVIAEHSRHVELEERYGRLKRIRLLRHGDSQLSFYRIDA